MAHGTDRHHMMMVEDEDAPKDTWTPDRDCVEVLARDCVVQCVPSAVNPSRLVPVIEAWLRVHALEFTPPPPERGTAEWFAKESARALAALADGRTERAVATAIMQDINDAAERAAGR